MAVVSEHGVGASKCGAAEGGDWGREGAGAVCARSAVSGVTSGGDGGGGSIARGGGALAPCGCQKARGERR